MNEDKSLSDEHRLLALFAGHKALRRFVLEQHAIATGEAMNKAELRLAGYIDGELDQMLADIATELGPDVAAPLDFRRLPPPTA